MGILGAGVAENKKATKAAQEQLEKNMMPANRKRLSLRLAVLTLSITLLAGCATGTNPQDPFESFNRGVYSFNEGLDRAILRPAAEVYRGVLPQFIRSSISNFFSNINDIVVVLNNLLQGKFTTAVSDFGRVAINSTIGVLGLFDVASEAGIEKHDEDFGQTLGWWGMGDGPFIMLPFFGPSTGRDAVGRLADYFTDPVGYVDPTRARNQLWGTRLVNRRSELLDASTVLQTAALDPYEFVRDAYLQRRRSQIYDGAPPPDREFLDPPPKPKTSRQSPYPTNVEPTFGTVLVSGDAQIPVTSPYAEAPAVTVSPVAPLKPALSPRAPGRIMAARTDGSPAPTGEPQTPAQWETLPPGQLTAAGAERPAQREIPRLTQFWRALHLGN
jgi:phospholipid-binding lipoprotein MlaA